MGKPVNFKTSRLQPRDVYGTQLKVEAVDAEGAVVGSSYVDDEKAAAAWFADLQAAQHETPAADLGATPEAEAPAHRRGRRE